METKLSDLSLSFSNTTAGKPIKCRAAVVRAAGEPLVIEEVIVDPPKAREVRIRIICTSLCFSDVTFWKLNVPPACFPRILGHEAVGVVESVGEDVKELTTGETVIPVFLPDCAECIDCKSDKSNLCLNFPFRVSDSMPRDNTSRFTDLKGETIHHFLWVSSFSEYTVVDIANLTKIDPSTPPNRACLFSCGVSTGVGAAWGTAKVEAGSTVAIFGLGSIGLAVAEGARLCGAKRIIGIDINPDKFETAKGFGVTDFVNSRECGDKSLSQSVLGIILGGGAGTRLYPLRSGQNDFKQTVKEVHPSLGESEGTKSISNETINQLKGAIQRLREVKIQRMQRLQDLATSLLELWNLMDTPIDEQHKFQNVTSNVVASEDGIIEPNILYVDFINYVSGFIHLLALLILRAAFSGLSPLFVCLRGLKKLVYLLLSFQQWWRRWLQKLSHGKKREE